MHEIRFSSVKKFLGGAGAGAAGAALALFLGVAVAWAQESVSSAKQINGITISGTPNGTKFLRDDGVWTAVSAGTTIVGYKQVTTETSTTSTTPADATGMSWAVSASTNYAVQCRIDFTNGTNGNGLQVGWDVDGTPTLGFVCETGSPATLEVDSFTTDDGECATTTANGTTLVNTILVTGKFTTDGSGTTAKLRVNSENAGQSATLMAGSYCTVVPR